MPSGGGASAVVSGRDAVADVRESVKVDRRDDKEAIVWMAVLLKRPQIELSVCFGESSISSFTAIFRVPRQLPCCVNLHRKVALLIGPDLKLAK